MKTRTLKKLSTIALVVAMIAPSSAFAQSSLEAYGGPNTVVAGLEQSGGGGGGDGTASSPAAGKGPEGVRNLDEADSLPFTGADLGVLATTGAVMLAFGFGLRRLTHRPSQI